MVQAPGILKNNMDSHSYDLVFTMHAFDTYMCILGLCN